jgi:hypothetical protein
LPCGDPRPSKAVPSYGPRTTQSTSVGTVDIGMNCTHFESLHPRPRLAAGKEVRVLHGSTPCWCRQTCEPSEWVSEGYVCAPMQDGHGCVRAFFRTVSPETRALSFVSTGARSFLLRARMRVALAYVQRACVPAKIGEFMRQLLRVIGWRVCCSPCAHHLACKKSNNAEEA